MMKFHCGKLTATETLSLRDVTCAALREWHNWFAWRAVPLGSGDCAWLETVQRKFPKAWVGPKSCILWREDPIYRRIQ